MSRVYPKYGQPGFSATAARRFIIPVGTSCAEAGGPSGRRQRFALGMRVFSSAPCRSRAMVSSSPHAQPGPGGSSVLSAAAGGFVRPAPPDRGARTAPASPATPAGRAAHRGGRAMRSWISVALAKVGAWRHDSGLVPAGVSAERRRRLVLLCSAQRRSKPADRLKRCRAGAVRPTRHHRAEQACWRLRCGAPPERQPGVSARSHGRHGPAEAGQRLPTAVLADQEQPGRFKQGRERRLPSNGADLDEASKRGRPPHPIRAGLSAAYLRAGAGIRQHCTARLAYVHRP